jgi:RluA family pseudouridine synthase
MPKPIPILFEDEHLLIVDKPAGLLSVPGAGRDLLAALSDQGLEVLPVHRIDRDVSGAVLLARTPELQQALQDLFRERALRKTYWALALGQPRRPQGEFKYPIDDSAAQARVSAIGKPSRTRWRVLAEHTVACEYEVDLVTGRKNQIRLHFAHAGHALVGERKYARGKDDPIKFKRVALHAWRLAFEHPVTGVEVGVEVPLAEDLVSLVGRLNP